MKLPKKIKKRWLIFGGIIFLFACLSPLSVRAYTSIKPPPSPLDTSTTRQNYMTDIFEPALEDPGMNLESYSWENLNAIFGSGVRLIRGETEENESDGSLGPGGALGSMAAIIGGMYEYPPASSVRYLADLGSRLNIAQPAYAQPKGIGFVGLDPILTLWKAFRNLAYVFFVIIFIVIGFSIMFRVRIDPQTVVGLQNALPRVVVALILVTFSYAIAGFIIDLLYIIIQLPLFALSTFQVLSQTDAQALFDQYTKADLIHTMGFVVGLGGRGLRQLVSAAWPGLAIGGGVTAVVGALLVLATGGIAGGGLVTLAGLALPVVLGLCLSVILFLFRILFMLIKAYVVSIILIIFGPVIILFDALPGRGGSSRWLTGLFSNLSVFAVAALLFIFADLIEKTVPSGANLWGPPLLGGGAQTVKLAVSLGVLMIIPDVAEIVQSTIEGKGARMPEKSRGVEELGVELRGATGKAADVLIRKFNP